MTLPSASLAMIATNAIFMGLAIIAVVVRIYVRVRHNPPLYIDDYLIFVALVGCWDIATLSSDLISSIQICSIALALTCIIGTPLGGFGVEFTTLTPAQQTHFFKVGNALYRRQAHEIRREEGALTTNSSPSSLSNSSTSSPSPSSSSPSSISTPASSPSAVSLPSSRSCSPSSSPG